MKLDLEQIRSITKGAADVREEDGYFRFFRFTSTQSLSYKNDGLGDFHMKTYATSGVRFAFVTDAKNITFDYRTSIGSSRYYGYFDVYVNDIMAFHFGQPDASVPESKAEIALDGNKNKVEIYFPWSRRTEIKNFELDGSFEPVSRSRKMICYGDSITQGYDAIYPSLAYDAILARLLDCDQINKGIAADVFYPKIIEKECASPDIVTVAYGTNDWSKTSKEKFEKNCTEFYKKVRETFPESVIFGITPIWRKDYSDKKAIGFTADELDSRMRSLCSGIKDIYFINGWLLTPHIPDFYSDKYLHPNDLGFSVYARNLYEKIKESGKV